jgi:hypothetical protein
MTISTHRQKIINLTNYILIASFLAAFLIYPIAYELPQLLLTLTIIVCLILTLNLHGTEEPNKPAGRKDASDKGT